MLYNLSLHVFFSSEHLKHILVSCIGQSSLGVGRTLILFRQIVFRGPATVLVVELGLDGLSTLVGGGWAEGIALLHSAAGQEGLSANQEGRACDQAAVWGSAAARRRAR